MQGSHSEFESLKAKIRADLRPVRPLAPAWRRGLALLPWIAVAAFVVAAVLGLRPDFDRLGVLLGTMSPVLLLPVGFVLFVLALRESVPGGGPRVSTLAIAIGLALTAQLVTAMVIHQSHPNPVPGGMELAKGRACGTWITILSLPSVLIAWRLVRRVFPTRPVRCGLLAALASVLVAESIWRLHCPFTDMAHIAAAHLSIHVPIAVLAVFLTIWESRRGVFR